MALVVFPAPVGWVGTALAACLLSVSPTTIFAQSAPTPQSASCDAPILDLFNPSAGDMLLPGHYLISGLALDPLATQGSGIDQVSVFLDNRDQGGLSLGTVVPSSGPRLDDFSVTVTLPDTNLGKHQFVAYAHSALTGKETEVSLPIVLGEDPGKTASASTTEAAVNTNSGVLPTTCASVPAVFVTPASPLPGVPPLAAASQTTAQMAAFGAVEGQVSTCQNGVQQPAAGVTVQAEGSSATTQTDDAGDFSLPQVPAPGVYTVAASSGESTADRQYVPVAPGETINVGILEFGVSINGCADDDQ